MRLLPVGDRALLVELGDQAAVRALYAEARRRQAGGLLQAEEIVPGALTMLFDGLADPAGVAGQVPHWRLDPPAPAEERLVEIPTVYDGADLAEVAAAWSMTTREAILTHSSFEYTVAFCGFAPGFAYLSGLPARLAVSRRFSPRASVPGGAVAVAGQFTGVYPRPSPGGWQLLGRTDVKLWDPGCDPPALLSPAVRVRFSVVAG